MKSARIRFTHTIPSEISENLKKSRGYTFITTLAESKHFTTSFTVFSFDDTRYPVNKEKIHDFFLMFKIWKDTGLKRCSTILIGLDPGSRKTGIALFLDGIFIRASTVQTSLENVEKNVRKIIELYSKPEDGEFRPKTTVKIGDGNYHDIDTVLKAIESMVREFNIQVIIVDEFRTNSRFLIEESSLIKISPDERAAINIALREGTPLQEYHPPRANNEFSRKQVKQVQHESRVLSSHNANDHLSIDRALATKVLLGKLTLQDAIKKHKGKN